MITKGAPAKALALKSDWPVPKKLEAGEVLIKVQAAALNPVGWKLMSLLPNLLANRPHVAEHDFSGVVVDANGTRFANGDQVFGWIPATLQRKTRQGTLTQYLKVPAEYVLRRPSTVTPIEASGIALAALTSYQALHTIAQLEPEQTILINGGSTAVGAFAIQIAKARGAKVVATASGKNEDFVRRIGADEFIDYTQISLHQYLKENAPNPKYQVIYDAVALLDPSLYTFSEAYLAPNGVFITTGPMPHGFTISEYWYLLRTIGAICTPRWLGGVKAKYSWIRVKNNVVDMKALQSLVTNGQLRPIVDSVHEFESALEAYDRIMTSRATGKVVVKIDPSVN